jgi:hypothetical protein
VAQGQTAPQGPPAAIVFGQGGAGNADGAGTAAPPAGDAGLAFSAARGTAAILPPQVGLPGDTGTIGFWFMPATANGTMTLLARHADADNGLVVQIVEGRLVLRQTLDGETEEVRTEETFDPYRWVSLALVWTEEGLQVWIDGRLVATLAGGGELAQTCRATVLGADYAPGAGAATGDVPLSDHFTGEIEDLALFDRALDAEALQAMMAEGAVPAEALAGECGVEMSAAEEWVDITPAAAE